MGVRQCVGAVISALLPDGNALQDAEKATKIPYINLTKEGMTIYFPKYGKRGNYGDRFYNALIAAGYKCLAYGKEEFTNEYGIYYE